MRGSVRLRAHNRQRGHFLSPLSLRAACIEERDGQFFPVALPAILLARPPRTGWKGSRRLGSGSREKRLFERFHYQLPKKPKRYLIMSIRGHFLSPPSLSGKREYASMQRTKVPLLKPPEGGPYD